MNYMKSSGEFIPMIILAQKGSTIYPNTNLPVTLWFYDDGIHNGNIVYMQNNYNKYTTGNDLIPISIDKNNPKVLEDIHLNIAEKDLKKVQQFIIDHYEGLIRVANNGEIDYATMEFTYINKFRQTVVDGFFTENISAKHSHLPVDLYCYCNNINYDDERDLYTLLMVNTYNPKSRFEDCVTVTIEKDNPHLLYDVQLGLSKKDFDKVKDFIKEHFDDFDKFIKNEDTSYDLHCKLENFG